MCNFATQNLPAPTPIPVCPLCDQPYTNEEGSKVPCLLPSCFHTFCRQCLWKTSNNGTCSEQTRSFDCPTCYEPCLTPVDALKTNFAVISDVKAARMASGQLCMTCEDCEEEQEAQHNCLDCGLLLCKECTKGHRRSKRTKEHELISVIELRALGKPPREAKRVCQKHRGKALRLFCKTCDCLICDDCTIKDHKTHNFDLLSDVVEQHKTDLVEAAALTEEARTPLLDAVEAIDAEMAKLSEAREATKAEVRAHFEEILVALHQRRAALEKEVDDGCESKRVRLAGQRERLAAAAASLSIGSALAKAAVDDGSEQEIAEAAVSLVPALKHAREKRREQRPETRAAVGFGVGSGEEREEMVRRASRYGRVWSSDVRGGECVAEGEGAVKAFGGVRAAFTVKTRSVKGQEWGKGGDLVEVRGVGSREGGGGGAAVTEGGEEGGQGGGVVPVGGFRSFVKKVRVTDNGNGSYEVEYLPEGEGPLGLDVRVNGEHIQGSPFTVQVPGVRLRMAAPFDGRGVVAYLGTQGFARPFTNPHDAGAVTASMSTAAVSHRGFTCGEPRTLVQGSVGGGKFNYTDNVRNSWMAVDLKQHRLGVEAYCLRSDACQEQHKLRSWRFEGSEDGKTWLTLREHANDHSLSGKPFSTAAWSIEGFQEHPLRHFRVVQTGVNSSGNNYLTCAGMELYGVLRQGRAPEEAMEEGVKE